MPPLVQLTVKLDTRLLRVSMESLRGHTRKLPSGLCNSACYNIAARAKEKLSRVSTAKMDEELNVTRIGMTKAGKPSNAKNPKKVYIDWQSPMNQTEGSPAGTPLAMMIVLASMYPTLKGGGFYGGQSYNELTGQIWKRQKPGTKGRADFWQWVIDRASAMVAARHSSGGYFKLCADVVRMMFMPAIGKDPAIRALAMTGAPAVAGGGSVTGRIGKIAGGIVAVDLGSGARASFWVSGTRPQQHKGEEDALFRIAQPVWQQAVDEVGAGNFKHATEMAYKDAARKAGLKVL